jgi:hypothetical protein
MNPRLMDDKRLHVATRRRHLGAPHVALGTLLAALLLLGAAQRGTDPTVSAQAPAPAASPQAGLTVIRNTAVPAPPPTFATSAARHHGGLYTYPATATTQADAVAAFGYYLEAMPGQGWTLLGKGDPARSGWTQRWQAGPDAALLTLTTQPRTTFSVQLCPPDPYC